MSYRFSRPKRLVVGRHSRKAVFINSFAALIATAVMGFVIHEIMWNDYISGQSRLRSPQETLTAPGSHKLQPVRKSVVSFTA
jgi:hypothetical protein